MKFFGSGKSSLSNVLLSAAGLTGVLAWLAGVSAGLIDVSAGLNDGSAGLNDIPDGLVGASATILSIPESLYKPSLDSFNPSPNFSPIFPPTHSY